MSAAPFSSSAASAPSRSTAVVPRERASQFHWLILEIEMAMKESLSQVEEISERGVLRNFISSSRDDLVAHAKGQNKVNTLLLRLQREVISLNTLGYTYLASLIGEFERQVNEGIRDENGKIHILSSMGKEVAQMATEMFNAILDASEFTQTRIDANTVALTEHEQRLAELTQDLEEQAEHARAFEQFQLESAQEFEAIRLRQSDVLSRLLTYERERAALQAQIATLQDEVSHAGEREVDLLRRQRRLLRLVWPAIAATAGLSLVAYARTVGLL